MELFRLSSLESLNKLTDADKTTLFTHLHEVEINKGCGSRPCQMCCYNAPISIGSMPFSVVQQIHGYKAMFGHNSDYWHFKSGDPLYYESKGRDYADVVEDAVTKGLSYPSINTHGFLPEEIQPQLAAKRLVEWAAKRGKNDLILFSLDPYGFINTSKDVHEAAIRKSIEVIAPGCGKIAAFYNPDDSEEGSLVAVRALVERTIPPELNHLVKYSRIFDSGRATKITPRSKDHYKPTTPGYLIDFRGNIFFTSEWQAVSVKVGNIYSGNIVSPLPAPIPRPPYFD